ncbi:methionine gamma-lyase family protein [Alkalibacillus salilacus]|uniref:Cystathionine beta-lyase family protein involved in aluminum resistance n=1 Tax=Alkalibacillus salilacus TaxID=284582 RepID=A0ABT9VDI1_9BACI|nr:aminotransferase class I/II-fold pyridoxal phosphate-dependent enzyme [Alkalibacillus salilacus]MDQ0159012.1 cystathionine beta-lyase family protein involved in aluminum resistance [Alkalibacillus salilacus]
MNEQDWQTIHEVETKLEDQFKQIGQSVTHNQAKVLQAFQEQHIADIHFNPTTGYGYDDLGREKLEALYASVFQTEDALVRPQIVSGTHAISTTLFGVLRPGDELLSITGAPYDTLQGVIGATGEADGSLTDFGIHYKEVELTKNGEVDFESISQSLNERTKMVMIQRSKGYADRPSFMIEGIKKMIEFVKSINPNVIVFVDNCYGEFVETAEPTEVGADLIAGSLIKNPGAGIVRTGGYIAGRQYLIEKCANRLTAPGLGKETGASLNSLQEMFQGLFLAPHTVGEALKGSYFTATLLCKLGFTTNPNQDEPRTDLIQSITFQSKDDMVEFAQIIQQQSPVNAYVTPQPSAMPGYDHEVIMAAGTFIQGASLELTADGPIRDPYTLYVQGGLTYEHVKLAIISALKQLNYL